MVMEEDGEPWELKFLKAYCGTDLSLDKLGYARRSVLAGGWYLASHASTTHPEVRLCGEGRVEGHMVRQWVEYYLARVRTETVWDALSKEQLKSVLEEVNSHLATRIFMVGNKLSLADIILYYGLHRYLAGMTFHQKSDYVNICRWFDQVQHFPGVKPFSLPLVVFHKNPDMLKL